jgi:hypothetical protein
MAACSSSSSDDSAAGGTGGAGATSGGTGGTAPVGAAGAVGAAGDSSASTCSFLTDDCNTCIPANCKDEEDACTADTAGCDAALQGFGACACITNTTDVPGCASTFSGTSDTAKAFTTCAAAHCATECGL